MANLGNIIPMISLEGWREKTDARRGKGVFDKVMAAFDLLYEEGVIYGASLTATKENCEEVTSDEFMDFLFNENISSSHGSSLYAHWAFYLYSEPHADA